MRNRAAALLILSLTTSCSRAPQHDTRSVAAPAPPSVVQSTSTSAPALATPTSPSASGAITSSTTTHPAAAIAPTTDPGADSASTAATSVVEAMIGGSAPLDLPDGALWIAVVSDGHVIQTTALSEFADRATVAISIAFENAADRAGVEPVGLRVELFHTEGTGWDVLGIGYL